MADLHEPKGPDPEFFKRLKKQLPSLRDEVEKKRTLRGHTPVSEMVPKKVCSVCGKGFDWGPIKGPIPDLAVCDKCQAKLDEGYTALKSDNRYAFIKSASLADMAGKIVPISPDVMEAVQKHYVAEWITKDEEKKSNEQKTSGQGENPQLN